MVVFLNICIRVIFIVLAFYTWRSLFKTMKELDEKYWGYTDDELSYMALKIIMWVIAAGLMTALALICGVFGALKIVMV